MKRRFITIQAANTDQPLTIWPTLHNTERGAVVSCIALGISHKTPTQVT